jgi:hypothetical protein
MEVSWAGVTLTEVAAPTDTRWIAEKVDSPVQVCGRRRVLFFPPFFFEEPKKLFPTEAVKGRPPLRTIYHAQFISLFLLEGRMTVR